ncbi:MULTISPECIES: aminotransferase class I/II-fold pyridoxal phosphate-dependent enzyme [Microbacterium]|jgi:alanine-synthesizing transaminase|uniref:alanine transaminase n=2 Tax=Microbacterium TaxID=33882 RepID=A0A3S9WP65_9MICO|nr:MULTISPECIES: aminotransferase class I/II-fold pyridoxal phosphate-dependent enzyme [Microbacterium]AZS41803.1 putative aspartate aminotransferase [Microbacterium oxydans]
MMAGRPRGAESRIGRSSRLEGVLYDLRGPVADRAAELEKRGESILRLNIGNPAPFGFDAPPAIVEALRSALPHAHGYSESAGLPETREAISAHYALRPGFPALAIDDITVGNGVSELVGLTLQALLEPGDEVLIPSPDYPLWTASTVLAGGRAVHYPCIEAEGWAPDLAAMEASIGPRTAAIVVINPNNPTGAVYGRQVLEQIAELARRHGLLLLSDEIYDRVVYPGFEHVSTAQVAPDVPCVTFAGLSKTHRVAGYRAAWMTATGFHSDDPFLSGVRLLASMRMCASVPAQHAITAALTHDASLDELVAQDGRLTRQRDAALDALGGIAGLDVQVAGGGLYLFPRLDPEVHGIVDDERLVLDFLDAERILLVHGRAFNLQTPDHLRIAFLPEADVLTDALRRLGAFLDGYSPPQR